VKKILIIGAGRSTAYLTKYLGEKAAAGDWQIVIADTNVLLAEARLHNDRMQAIFLDISDIEATKERVQDADIIVSMLPADMHISVAKLCLQFRKNMVTASYISNEMKALNSEAERAGVMILNEMGVDPGIDHLSAMETLDTIREDGGMICEFESFTGGLVAPGFDNNPWKYKFTWNPRNVVTAGQGGAAKFLQDGQFKYIPYHKIFRRTEIVEIDGYGKFEGYANRDSLKYREIYGLSEVKTMFRGTFRRPGFCKAWNCFIDLGATDDSYLIEDSQYITNRDFINTFLPYHPTDSVELKLRQYLKIDQDDTELWEKIVWLGIFERENINLKKATPAQILQQILEKKWHMDEGDKDMIVMWHKIVYEMDGKSKERQLSMVCIGEDENYTAMAKTVGLPLGISVRLILEGKLNKTGVVLPVTPDIYKPVLSELKTMGISFTHKDLHH
jgi:saccharopine dehydrogenase-like NADP-dependent oxidoreductase